MIDDLPGQRVELYRLTHGGALPTEPYNEEHEQIMLAAHCNAYERGHSFGIVERRLFSEIYRLRAKLEHTLSARGLTFAELAEANLRRAVKWHKGGLDEWSVADWATAMAGEAGEVCNAVKKLRRIEDEISNISEPDRQLSTREAAYKKIGDEIADTLIYLDLLAQRIGINTAEAVIEKYNAVSVKYGFPDRIPSYVGEKANG